MMNLPSEIFGNVIVVHSPEELAAEAAEHMEVRGDTVGVRKIATRHRFDHVRPGPAGAHGIHADAVGRVVEGLEFGELSDSRFAHRVHPAPSLRDRGR